jgi:short-subunit dehydrogenase
LQASKAAVTNFFHTLRIELGDSVPITIFSPGVTKSELSDGKLAQGEGKVPEAGKARDLRNVRALGRILTVPWRNSWKDRMVFPNFATPVLKNRQSDR